MFPPHRNRQRRRQAAIPLELTQQLSPMHQASHQASRGMEDIVHTHQQAAEYYAKMLAEGEKIVQEAECRGTVTPFQQEALNHYQMAYLYEMLAIAEESGDEIIEVVRRLSGHQEGYDGND